MGKITHGWLLLITLLLAASSYAQEYPYKIAQGSEQTVLANEQAIWVLKESQFDKALADSKKLKLEEEKNNQLQQQIQLMQEKNNELRSLADTLKSDRDFYMENWETTNTDLHTLNDQLKKQKRKTKIYKITTFAGIPIAFIIGLFLL